MRLARLDEDEVARPGRVFRPADRQAFAAAGDDADHIFFVAVHREHAALVGHLDQLQAGQALRPEEADSVGRTRHRSYSLVPPSHSSAWWRASASALVAWTTPSLCSGGP